TARCKHLGKTLTAQHLAVDEDAITVEDDQVELAQAGTHCSMRSYAHQLSNSPRSLVEPRARPGNRQCGLARWIRGTALAAQSGIRVVDHRPALASRRCITRWRSTTIRSWVPLPISSTSSRAVTAKTIRRPSTSVTSASAVTRCPSGVAAT